MTKALVTIRETHWSGWDGGHLKEIAAQVWAEAKTTLSPETLGRPRPRDGATEYWFYEVEIERIAKDLVSFAYRGLVIANTDGTTNLMAERTGRFALRRGETIKLSTATMDAGISVAIDVHEIC